MSEAKYIWTDRSGEGRNLHGMFRRSVVLNSEIKTAELYLFADSVYELFINGEWLDFGPARFDPVAPEYDTYDLSEYLRPGKNVIAVLVKQFGCQVYRAMPARAGMIAWGSIHLADGESIDLQTGSAWKAQESAAYQRMTPKMSFALEPMEVFEQANEPAGWQTVDFDDGDWDHAVAVENTDCWGALRARSIPMMSGKEVLPERVMHVAPLQKTEQVFSFRVPAYYWFAAGFSLASRKEFKAVLFYSWIFSPKAQDVPVGLFWGEHWLNGTLLTGGKASRDATLRVDYSMKLEEGWNFFVGKVDVYSEVIDFYMGLPKDCGLLVNADRDLNGENIFYHTAVMPTEEYNALGGDNALPFAPDAVPKVSCGWIAARKETSANNPARERDWDSFGPDVPLVTPSDLTGYVFRKEDFPEGFAVELDVGAMRLLKAEVDLSGVTGATVDLAYSEYLHDGSRAKMYPTHEYHSASRANCSRHRLVWNPVQPHGARYLVLTVRNPKEDVTLNRLTLRSAEYPVQETGSFRCSDLLLNQIWEMCRRTEMTDMEDAYIDCPGRERGMYIRDTIIQYHNNLAMFGDQKLMRRCLDLYGRSAAPDGKFRATYPFEQDYTISDFCLNAVEGFWNYVEHSGDISVVREHWEAIKTNLQWFNELSDEREDGLLNADWHIKRGKESRYMGFHGDNQSTARRDGVNGVFSSFYVCALQAGAKLAERLGDQPIAEEYARRAKKVSESINAWCWDEKKQAYADTIEKKSFSPQAAMLAVRCGAVGSDKRDVLRRFFEEQVDHLFVNEYDPAGGAAVSPHFCFYLFEALYELGLANLAERLMREGWSWMQSLGTATCTEFFSEKGSWCHAWSASPAYYLSKHALGIHVPDETRPDEVDVRVQSALSSVDGVWPHTKGPIHIKWHMDGDQRIFDCVEAPEGVSVTVVH
jgi:hypothetical protein